MTTLLERACAPAAVLAALALGLSAGAMLAEAALLAPYWRSLPPQEFLDWFAANHQRLVDFYSPIEVTAAAAPLIATILHRAAGRAGTRSLAAATMFAVAVLATYFVYFQAANASFVDQSIALDAVAGELGRWTAWQWARVGLGIGAFLAALGALRG